MKKIIFTIFVSLLFVNCNFSKPKSGIILWEYNPDLSYEKILLQDFEEIKNNSPKSIFIDFNDIKNYSKSNHVFTLNSKTNLANADLEYLEHFNEKRFFSIYLDGKHYLTGIAYMCYLSAQMPVLSDKNLIFLISEKDDSLKLTNSIFNLEYGFENTIKFDYDLSELEKYFFSCNKLRE